MLAFTTVFVGLLGIRRWIWGGTACISSNSYVCGHGSRAPKCGRGRVRLPEEGRPVCSLLPHRRGRRFSRDLRIFMAKSGSERPIRHDLAPETPWGNAVRRSNSCTSRSCKGRLRTSKLVESACEIMRTYRHGVHAGLAEPQVAAWPSLWNESRTPHLHDVFPVPSGFLHTKPPKHQETRTFEEHWVQSFKRPA